MDTLIVVLELGQLVQRVIGAIIGQILDADGRLRRLYGPLLAALGTASVVACDSRDKDHRAAA